MSILAELLSIKAFRETRAEVEVRKERARFAEALAAREAAEKSLDEFKAWAQAQELAWYEDLCQRVVRLRDIEDVQHGVAGLRNQEVTLDQQRQQAQTHERQQEQRLGEAKVVLSDATRVKEKFVELVRLNTLERLQDVERKEDAELEEVAELRRDRADWEEFHEEEVAA
jgi:type III secretion protein O